jgi:hypothetical protein
MAALVVKTIVTLALPVSPSSDFANWVHLAQVASDQIRNGTIPSVETFGAYTFMGIILVPFFLVWSALSKVPPVFAVALLGQSSLETYFLVFMMKLPIILGDFLSGIMISLIATRFRSGVPTKGFWIWFLNPYTTYLMEYGGTFDILPTLVFLGALYLGLQRKWFGSGFLLAVASLLRFFPVFAFPFFTLQALKQKSKRGIIMFLFSYGLPILAVISVQVAMNGSLGGFMGVISYVIANQPWLLVFLGFSLSSFVNLTPFLLIIQIYLVVRYWKSQASLVDSALVGVLVLLVASYHQPYDVTWIIPLITIYYLVNSDWTILYTLLIITSYLYYVGFNTPDLTISYVQPLFAGLFYGVKGVYLIRANVKAFGWKKETVRKYAFGL